MPARSLIHLRCIADTGTFARYVPFADERQIVVRRGAALGHDYGLQEPGDRSVTISGIVVTITRHTQILSPPVLEPGNAPMPGAEHFDHPEFEVLRLPDAEVLIQRSPDGFSDEEVIQILAAITIE